MSGRDSTSVLGWMRSGAWAAGVAVALLGALIFSGWMFHAPALVRLSGELAMKTNASLCMLLCGAGLLLLILPQPRGVRLWMLRGCAMAVLLLGALTLLENIVGWDLCIDQVLAQEARGVPGVLSPNRMGMPASTSFVLAGLAMLILSRDAARSARVAQGLAIGICLIAMLSIIGYLYGATNLYGVARFTAIAWLTAVLLLLLGLGLLCARADEGLMAAVAAPDPGGAIIRRLVLPFVVVSLGLGWVRLVGQREGWFDAAMGTGLLVLIFMTTFSTLAFFGGRQVSRAVAEIEAREEAIAQQNEELAQQSEEMQQQNEELAAQGEELAQQNEELVQQADELERQQQDIRQSEERFRSLAESIPNLAWWANADGFITWYNRRWYEYTGTTPKEMEGWGWQSVHHPETLPAVLERWKGSIASGEPFEMTFPLRGADGIFRPFLTRVHPLKDAEGRVVQWFGTNTDVDVLKRAEEALHQSQQQYHTLFNTLIEGFCIIEVLFDANDRPIDYRFLEINPAFERQTGLRDAQGKRMRELAPEHEEHWFQIYGNVALTGQAVRFVNEAKALNRWYDVSAYRVGGAESRKVAILFNDITERKQAEEVLRQSERRLEGDVSALTRMHDLSTRSLSGATIESMLQEVMETAVAIMGADKGTLQVVEGEGLRIVAHHGHDRPFLEFFAAAENVASVCGEATRRGERVVVADVEQSPLFAGTASLSVLRAAGVRGVQSTPMMTRDGRLLGILTTHWAAPYVPGEHDLWRLDLLVREATDLIEQARAEAAVRESERTLLTFLNTAATGLVRNGRDLRYRSVNAAYAELVGRPLDQIEGRLLGEVLGEQALEKIRPDIERVLRGERVEYETELPIAGTGSRWIHAVYTPDRDAAGEVIGWVGSITDITKRKQAEEAVRQSELFFRQTLESIPGMVFTTRPDGYCDYQSQQWVDFTGVPMSQHVGDGWNKLLHEEDRPRAFAAWRDAVEGRAPYDVEYRVRRHDGQYEWFKVRGRPIRDSAGQIVRWFGVATSIDAQKQAEEAIRRHNAELEQRVAERTADVEKERKRLYEVLETLPAMICLLTPDYHVAFANRSFRERFGESSGRHCYDFCFGKREPCDFCQSYEVLKTGKPHHWEVAGEDGSVIDAYDYPFTDVDGSPLILEMDIDITAQKRAQAELEKHRLHLEDLVQERTAELAAAKTQAEQASAAKDQFLAVLSHELRNPLAPVLVTVGMLRRNPALDARTHDALEVIGRNVELEARLIDDLLDVTRITRGKLDLVRRPVDIRTVIERAVEVCMPDIEARKLHFGVDLDHSEPWVVDADAARLQQVFWNLLKNSVKFTPEGGCVGIRVRKESAESEVLSAEETTPHFIVIEVNDSGVGIEPEAMPRIFNAFEQAERSKVRQFGGLGLGLTISKAMVEMHGGSISAHSAGRNKGATFNVRLPLAKEGVRAQGSGFSPGSAEPGALPPEPRALAPTLRILLVEDHGDTARIMRLLLLGSGHQVETAADVASALRLAREKTFDLLLSDLGLPDASGLDLMRALREAGQAMPAIALSGYGQEEDVKQSRLAGFAAHLTKPVDPSQLEETIAKVVGGLPSDDGA